MMKRFCDGCQCELADDDHVHASAWSRKTKKDVRELDLCWTCWRKALAAIGLSKPAATLNISLPPLTVQVPESK